MTIVTKTVSQNIRFFTHKVDDDFSLVRAQWESSGEDGFNEAIMENDNVDKAIEASQMPSGIMKFAVKKTKVIPSYVSKTKRHTLRPMLIKNNDPGNAYFSKDYSDFYDSKSFQDVPSQDAPNGFGVYFSAPDHNYIYDRNLNILNTRVEEFVLAEDWDLKGLIELSKSVDWLDVFGSRSYSDDLIYYVHGNGDTLNIRLNLTPDEYTEMRVNKSRVFDSTVKAMVFTKLGEEAASKLWRDRYAE